MSDSTFSDQSRSNDKSRIKKLEAVLEGIHDGVFIGDHSGITECNRAGMDMLGFNSLDDLTHTPVNLLAQQIQNADPLTGKPLSTNEEPFVRALNGETVVKDVSIVHLKTKQRRVLRSAARPVRVDGKVIGAVVVNTDITKQFGSDEERLTLLKLSQRDIDQLREERQVRERFVSTLTHDLRTPLTAAKMSAELLLRKLNDVPLSQKLIVKIISSVDRANRMIQDLLDANRISAAQKLVLNVVPCHLNEIVAGVFEEFCTVYGDRFKLVATEQIHGFWDHEYIRRSIENLCGNAIKYGSPHEAITVTLSSIDENVSIAVHNFGNPIGEADQKSLFQPFHRSSAAEDSGQIGWGLGLTLVRGTAEAHGGSVGLDSSKERGTTFLMKFSRDARPVKGDLA